MSCLVYIILLSRGGGGGGGVVCAVKLLAQCRCACTAGGRVIGLSVTQSVRPSGLSSEGLVEGIFHNSENTSVYITHRPEIYSRG